MRGNETIITVSIPEWMKPIDDDFIP